MLALERVIQTDFLEQFRGKGRNTAEAKLFALGQGIADTKRPVVRNADDITRPGFFGNVTLVGKEQHRVMHRHLFARTNVLELHAALEMARAQTNKRNAVTMVRVDVGLYLEHKARHLWLNRFDQTRCRLLRARGRCDFANAAQQFTHAKVIDGRPKEDWCQMPFAIALQIKWRAHFAHHFDFLAQLFQKIIRDQLIKLWIIKTLDRNGFLDDVAAFFHEQKLIIDQIITTMEITARPDRPGYRRDIKGEILFDLINQFE